MHNAQICPNCHAAAAAAEDATISDALIASGVVILVCGVNYAAFEEAVRPVFSEMPSNFEKHFGACFLRYQSGGSHKHDFTLLVAGENNDQLAPLLQELLPRLKHIVVIGPVTDQESDLLLGGSLKFPDSSTFISAPGVKGSQKYYAIAMQQSLLETKPNTP